MVAVAGQETPIECQPRICPSGRASAETIYPKWYWEAASHFEAANLGDTMDGSNRSRLNLSDAKIKAKYKKVVRSA